MDTNYKEQMIRDWGLADFPQEEQDQYIDRIGQALYKSIVMRATDTLNEKGKDAFDVFLDAVTTEGDMFTVLDYLNTHVPTFEQIRQEETAKLKVLLTIPTQ